jgi:hypothetical protein
VRSGVMLVRLEVDVNVVEFVGFGAMKTMPGIEDSTTNVAVSVWCVSGRALACPSHIAKAVTATSSIVVSEKFQNLW